MARDNKEKDKTKDYKKVCWNGKEEHMKRTIRKYWLLMAVIFLLALMPMAVWAQNSSASVSNESSSTAVKEAAGNTNLATGTDVGIPDISSNGQPVPTVALPQLESDKSTVTVETPEAKIESQSVSGVFEYEAVSGGVSITKYNGYSYGYEVSIPDTLDGKPVVKIGSGAFKNSYTVSRVIIGNNVKTIESNAFNSYLSKLTIPVTTTEIAADAIVQTEYSYSSVTIYGTKGSAAESFAKGLANARFLNLNMVENDFYYEDVAGGVKITYYDGSETPVIIPETLNGQPVVQIGSKALTDCYGGSIIVGNNVKTIESNAFNSYLKKLTIPETTTEIAADAIVQTEYSFNTVTIYGSKGSAAESFTKGLTNARFLDLENGENGFWYEDVAGGVKIVYYDGSESALIIPDMHNGKSVVAIGSNALTDCKAESIIVGNNVKTIESKAFSSTIKRLTIPQSTTDIATDAGSYYYTITILGSKGSAAESFAKGFDKARFLAWEDRKNNFWVEETEGGIKIIGYDDSEEKVTIPSTLGGLPMVAIGTSAFTECNTVKEVTIPDSVMLLENGDYYGGNFYSCNSLEKLTLGKGISQIPSYMASNCINLKEVVINGNIKTIGSRAFSGCQSLTNINLPDSLESIGTWAFNRCNNLSSITIPDKTATIEAGAFIYCEKLTDLTFGSGLTSLDGQAFAYCNGLETVSIPDKTKTIGAAAFTYCKKLTSITFGSGLTSLGGGALAWCESLKTVSIPEGLTTIDSGGVFLGDPALSKVVIPKSVTSITSNIFDLSPKTNIYGIKGSYAQTYAQKYSIPFVEQGAGGDPTDEPGIGELTGFIGQDPEGNYFLYNKADFNNAYLAYQINPDLAAAKMYQHFINQKCAIVALRDVTKGYMDYNAAATASLLAQMKGESFDINAYFGRSDAKIYGQSVNNVANVAKDGSVTY